jgi:serine/threonine-protein kinase
VTVPDVVGLSPEEAVAAITQAELEPAAGEEFRGDCTEGEVTGQAPGATARADVGSVVTYRVCAGPEQVEVPLLEGATRAAAESLLEEAGLVPNFIEQDDDLAEGTVISTDPEAGTVVDKGDSIDVYVSAGNIREVPDVRGLDRAIAIDRLEQSGFIADPQASGEPPGSPEDVGTVESQDPAPGSELPVGDPVTIFIYGEGDPLSVPVPTVDADEVTVTWDNGIYGGVTIDWGDGVADTFNAAEGSESHTYAAPGPVTITVTATEFDDRSVSHQVMITP